MKMTSDANSGDRKAASNDLFDPAKLRVEHVCDESIGVEKVITTVGVMRPPKQTFFRVNPSLDMRLDARIIVIDNDTYICTPPIAAEFPGETKAVRFLVCIARHGGIFLWPLNLPSDFGRENSWTASAHKASSIAETKWTRMQSNRALGCYDVVTSVHIPDPVWPEVTLQDLLKIAFGGGRLINSADHPVIQQLLGKC
jgi:hypothetical protein